MENLLLAQPREILLVRLRLCEDLFRNMQYDGTKICLDTLAGGTSCQMSVAFKPTTGGPVSGYLRVTDSANDSPQSVALAGNGIAPPMAVSLSPSSLAFPDTQQVGSTSAPQTITLTNTGGSNLNIPGMSYPNGFILPAQNCLGTLAAGASCQISVAFKPTTGAAFSGNLQITDDANSPQSVALERQRHRTAPGRIPVAFEPQFRQPTD